MGNEGRVEEGRDEKEKKELKGRRKGATPPAKKNENPH